MQMLLLLLASGLLGATAGGTLGNLFGGTGTSSSSLLPLMLLGGGSSSMSKMLMPLMLIQSGMNPLLALMATGSTGTSRKRSYRRRSSTATKIAYLQGAVSVLRRS